MQQTPIKKLNKNLTELYAQAFDKINHGVMWLTEDGKILRHNARLAESLGYTDDTFSPQLIFEVNPHLNLFEWKNLWKELQENGSFDLDTQHISADELVYSVKIHGLLFREDDRELCCAFIENPHEDERTQRLLELTSSVTHAGSWEYDVVKDDWFFTDEVFLLLNIEDRKNYSKDSFFEQLAGVLSAKDLKVLQLKFENSIAECADFSHSFTLRGEPGRELQMRMSGVPEGEDGNTLSVFGVIQDMSEIADSPTHRKDFILAKYAGDHAREMIYWVDASGKITYLNHSAGKSTDYTPTEVVGKLWSKIDVTSTPENWRDLFKRVKTEKHLLYESVHRSKSGNEFPVEISASVISHEGNDYFCGMVRDLTKKKKRDLRLELYKTTVKKSPIMICWIDYEGNLVFANESYLDFCGYTKEDNLQIHQVSGSYDSVEEWQADWETFKNNRKRYYKEGSIINHDGVQFPADIESVYVEFDNREFMCVFVRDISERKAQEKALKESLEENINLNERLSGENQMLRSEIQLDVNLNNIITRNRKYQNLLLQLQQVADTEATVLITGETGTGKELLAKSVHNLSRRADYGLVSVNCAALPENLFESELFGHEKGSFTGAHQMKRGRFELAHRGTIFLDEVGEMPLSLQAKLLRVLQEGEFERIGGNKTIRVNVRVVAATNRDLEKMVEEGTFREDLYYRLNVFPLHNIPLRERKDDIPLLIEYFLRKYTKRIGREVSEISNAGLRKIMNYDFPGNVRELENMVERALIVSNGKTLDLGKVILNEKKSKKRASKEFKSMEDAQRDHIIAALEKTGWRVSGKSGAAHLLQMNDKTLYSRMTKLGIKRK